MHISQETVVWVIRLRTMGDGRVVRQPLARPATELQR
jgi:hypothetical protein